MRHTLLAVAALLVASAAAPSSGQEHVPWRDDDATSTALAARPDGEVMLPAAAMSRSSALEKAQKGLDAAQKFVEIFNSDIFAGTKVKIVAEVLSKTLSFVVSILDLINGETSESPEMKFMREQFSQVHNKLDSINLKLDDVKDLISWRTTRVMFAQMEVNIMSSSRLFDRYVKASDAEKDIRQRHFVQSFAAHRQAAFKLYQAVVEKDYVIADNLAAAAVHFTKNHRRQVMNFLLALNRLILRGAQMHIAYERLVHSEAAASIVEGDWKLRMEKLANRMHEVDNNVQRVWHSQMKSDMQGLILSKRDLSNKEFSGAAYKLLAEKFHWRHWIVAVYKDVSGFQNHAISQCGGAVFFRVAGDRNVAVGSADPKTSRFSTSYGDAILARVQARNHNTKDADKWLNEINAIAGNCNSASFRAVICWGCDVWFYSLSSRQSYRKISVGRNNVNAVMFG